MRTLPVIGLPLGCTDYIVAVAWILEKAAAPSAAVALEAANTQVAALGLGCAGRCYSAGLVA